MKLETRPAQGGKLTNVEAGRGIAALLVVLFHITNYYFSSPEYWADGALGGFFLFGHAGVEFFFVLSGFIMVWVHRKDVGQPARVGAFAWKRFQRIYPFFWLVLAVTVAMAFAIPSAGADFYRDPLTIMESTALVGRDPMHAVVFVSWTLWHEVVFYAFCAAVIAWPKVGIPAFIAWVIACASQALPGYAFHYINVLFAVGAGVALCLQRWTIPRPAAFLAAGVIVFLGTGVASVYTTVLPEWVGRYLFGLGSALALIGAVELERAGRLAAPKFLQVLGAASFSLYLTHMLTLSFMAKAAALLGLPHILPPLVAFLGFTAGAVIVGVAAHYLVERRVIAAMADVRTQIRSRAVSVAQ